MVVRNEYPPGVPCWVDLEVPDPDVAVAFYGGMFGWQFEDQMPPDGPGHYYMARLDGLDVAAVGSEAGGSHPTPAWNTYVAVGDADDAAVRVQTAGGRVLVEPFDVFDAGRMAVCRDPAGAEFRLWQANKRAGAQLVDAPGSWVFSNLETPDLDGAIAFYGAVFGWEAKTLSFGSSEATMLRLPGYGDFLATIDPDIRERHRAEGVPEGFSDAIGWLATTTDAPAHWSVNFATDDTDAVVDRAVHLGGKVVVAPFDADVVRIATIEDPHGAVVTLNAYQP